MIFDCPHCGGAVFIEEVNCGIFRHGILKSGEQVPPHAPKEECDNLAQQEAIYGCGRPFQIVQIDGEWRIQVCEYI